MRRFASTLFGLLVGMIPAGLLVVVGGAVTGGSDAMFSIAALALLIGLVGAVAGAVVGYQRPAHRWVGELIGMAVGALPGLILLQMWPPQGDPARLDPLEAVLVMIVGAVIGGLIGAYWARHVSRGPLAH